jgi:NosR/NirI family nitrous oxide reductase transcriptional regulator
MILLVLIPFFAAAGGILFYNLAPALSVVNSKVRLAREIRIEKESGLTSVSKSAAAFMESGKTEDELFAEEASIISGFRKSSPWAGIFLGASLGIALVSLTIRSKRTEYKPDQGKCYSCGRCFKYCPVKLQVQNEA